MKRKLWLFVIVVLSYQLGKSCSFLPTSFCFAASKFEDQFIFHGYITEVDTLGITIEILNVIRGEEFSPSIRVWDGTDFDCNGPHSMAAADLGKVGDTLIFLLPRIDSLENTWDQLGDYRRPRNYGYLHTLWVENGVVKGLIEGDGVAPPGQAENNIYQLGLSRFIETFASGGNCDQLVSVGNTAEIPEIKLYPNPITRSLAIRLGGRFKPLWFELINIHGKKMVSFVVSSKYLSIQLETLPKGLYVAVFRWKDDILFRQKMIKN